MKMSQGVVWEISLAQYWRCVVIFPIPVQSAECSVLYWDVRQDYLVLSTMVVLVVLVVGEDRILNVLSPRCLHSVS